MTLFIDHRPEREGGQYHLRIVRLHDVAPGSIAPDSLGSWCDKGHLRHVAHLVLAQFGYGYEDVKRLLDAPRCVPCKSEPHEGTRKTGRLFGSLDEPDEEEFCDGGRVFALPYGTHDDHGNPKPAVLVDEEPF